jgi:hypothetical protein
MPISILGESTSLAVTFKELGNIWAKVSDIRKHQNSKPIAD